MSPVSGSVKARSGPKTEGELAQTFRLSMVFWDQQKAEGVPLGDRIAGLERVLKVAWPQTRAWKYLCPLCSDRGLEMLTCPGDATCYRSQPHLPHDYGVACRCQAGNRFKAKAPEPDDYLTAGKTKVKKGGMSRWNS